MVPSGVLGWKQKEGCKEIRAALCNECQSKNKIKQLMPFLKNKQNLKKINLNVGAWVAHQLRV